MLLAGLDRTEELLANPPEGHEPACTVALPRVRGDIVFDGVSFGYREDRRCCTASACGRPWARDASAATASRSIRGFIVHSTRSGRLSSGQPGRTNPPRPAGDRLASSQVVLSLTDHQEFLDVDLQLLADKRVIATRGIWREQPTEEAHGTSDAAGRGMKFLVASRYRAPWTVAPSPIILNSRQVHTFIVA